MNSVNSVNSVNKDADAEHVLIPIISLEPDHIQMWAKLVTGRGNSWTPAFRLRIVKETSLSLAKKTRPTAEIRREPNRGQAEISTPEYDAEEESRQADAMIRQFRAGATPAAQRLAELFATIGVLTMPVMRAIQDSLVPTSGLGALAEVLMSGMLRAEAGSPQLPGAMYLFRGQRYGLELRKRLWQRASTINAIEAMQQALEILQKQVGDFLASPYAEGDRQLVHLLNPNGRGRLYSQSLVPFATVAAEYLRSLGALETGGTLKPFTLPYRPLKIFISASYPDRQEECQIISHALDLLPDTFPTSYETLPTHQRGRADRLPVVADSDLLVIVPGVRTGSGELEEEYRTARQYNKPCIVYLCKNASLVDSARALFVEELRRDNFSYEYNSIRELENRVTHDIRNAQLRNWIPYSLFPWTDQCMDALRIEEKEQALAVLNYLNRTTVSHLYGRVFETAWRRYTTNRSLELPEREREIASALIAMATDSYSSQSVLWSILAMTTPLLLRVRENIDASVIGDVAPYSRASAHADVTTDTRELLDRSYSDALASAWAGCIWAAHNLPSGFTLAASPTTGSQIFRMAWSPRDGKRLAMPCINGTIHVWHMEPKPEGTMQAPLQFTTNGVNQVAWSPEGDLLAAACYDRLCRIYDLRHGRLLDIHLAHQSDVQTVAWSPDGRLLATGSRGGSVRLWDTHSWQIKKHAVVQYPVDFVAWRPETTNTLGAEEGLERGLEGHLCLAFVTLKGPVGVVGVQGEEVAIEVFDVATGNAICLAWLPDGLRFVVGMDDGRLVLWDAGSGQKVEEIHAHKGAIAGISLSAPGKEPLLAVKSLDGTVSFWGLTSLLPGEGSLVRLDVTLDEAGPENYWAPSCFPPNRPGSSGYAQRRHPSRTHLAHQSRRIATC